MTESADVAIVGGGVIGLLCAWELSRLGRSVILLERDEPGRAASWAGAGIIAPGNPRHAVSAEDRLRAESSHRWPSLAEELESATGLPTGYRRCGGIEHGDVHNPAWDRERLRYEPVDDGFHFPDMAQVRNPWMLRSLAEAVRTAGVSIRTHSEIVGWERRGNRVLAAVSGQGPIVAGEYLLCGGAWSQGLIDLDLRVKPMRGQMVAYRLIEGGPQQIHIWDKQYLVPRGDGLILAGSTEEDVGFDAKTTADGIGQLRRFAETRWPALREATIEATWAGLRPASVDHRPTIGRVPVFENLTVATGHFRAGIQHAPATARLVAEILTGQAPFIPLDSFRPDRPIGPPSRPAFRS